MPYKQTQSYPGINNVTKCVQSDDHKKGPDIVPELPSLETDSNKTRPLFLGCALSHCPCIRSHAKYKMKAKNYITCMISFAIFPIITCMLAE